jgi:hypothetical protein
METPSREESRSTRNLNQLSNILDKTRAFKESSLIFNSLEIGASDLCEIVIPFAKMHDSREFEIKESI